MDNTIFGENTLYVQRMFSTVNPSQYSDCQKDKTEGVGTRNFGILADRVKKLGYSKKKEDYDWLPYVGYDNAKYGMRMRALKFKDLQGAKILPTVTSKRPTNKRNYESWARDIALTMAKQNAHRKYGTPQEEEAWANYEDLKAGRDTPFTREALRDAMGDIRGKEKWRTSKAK